MPKISSVKIALAIIGVVLIAWVVVSHKNTTKEPIKNEGAVVQGSQNGGNNISGAQEEATGEANLSWNANKEPDLAGYRIYYGTTPRTGNCPSGGYPEKIEVGNTTSYKVEHLKEGETYYFSITSYNKGGKESCFSAEVHKLVK